MVEWAEEGDEYQGVAELVARTIQVCSSNKEEEGGEFGNYNLMLETVNKICHQLSHLILQNDQPQVCISTN